MMQEIEHQDEMLRDVNRVAALLLTVDSNTGIDSQILTSMEIVCNSVGGGRVNIWRNEMRDGFLYHTCEYSWCSSVSEEYGTFEKGMSLTHDKERPEWKTQFYRGEHISGPLSEMPEKDQVFLGAFGMKSVIIIPLFINDHFWGLFSIDEFEREKNYSEDEVPILKSVSLMMASAIHRHSLNADIMEAQNQIALLFEATPLGCSLWDENVRQTNANQEMVNLFGLKDKQEYIDRFTELYPEYQPNGVPSAECARENLRIAYRDGYRKFEFLHRKPDGTPIPSEVTLIRMQTDKGYVVAAYIRDMREYSSMMKEIDYQRNLLETVNRMSMTLLEPDIRHFEKNIHTALGMIANALDADRVYVHKFYREKKVLFATQLYEWSENSPPQQGNEHTTNVRIPVNCECDLIQGKCVNGLVRELTPEQQLFLEPQGIVSILNVPIFIQDELWGLVGFDDCSKERVFTENEELTLRSASRIIANALIRNEMTREILDKSAQLKETVKHANKANKIKSDFLAKMSHEIRTPMNAIIGLTELALRESMPETVREHISMVKQAGVNLLSIVNDILDISKIESGNMQIIPTEYLLSSLVNDVISIIRMRAVESRIRFVVYLDSNLPNALVGDETRIRQILINLLGNAVKYTDKGFVSFSLYGEKGDEDTIDLKMVVKDSGRGIREEEIEKLFDNYYQPDPESNVGIEGVGLGLPISRSLAESMGGEILVESEYGKGSTFTVTLPQKINNHEKIAEVANSHEIKALVYERRDVYADAIVYAIENIGVSCELAKNINHFSELLDKGVYSYVFISHTLFERVRDVIAELDVKSRIVILADFGESIPIGNWSVLSMPLHSISAANVFNGVSDRFSYHTRDDVTVWFTAPEARVLIVDDIKTNLKVAKGLLAPYKMAIDLCSGGREAVEAVRNTHYDLVLMDHRMPGMDGVEAAGQIKALSSEGRNFKDLPLVALTANAISGMEEYFLQRGFCDYLTKPIDTVKLNAILEKWIPKEKQAGCVMGTLSMPEECKVSNVPFAIEGLDVDKGVQRSGGKIESYFETLAAFYGDWQERKSEVGKSLAAGNLQVYSAHIHALKGACANIGADKLSEAAGALEAAGRRGDLSFVKSRNDSLLSMLQRLLVSINYALAMQNIKTDKEDDEQEVEMFSTELARLKHALDDLDFERINKTVDVLLVTAPTFNARNTVRSILKHILMFDYEKAESYLNSLL